MTYYARMAAETNGNPLPDASLKAQPLRDHLRAVGALAAEFAAVFNAADEARLAGLLHDLGKYHDDYQDGVRQGRTGDFAAEHALYGAAWAAEESRQHLFPTMLAVAGHHGGLPDHGELEGLLTFRQPRLAESLPTLLARFESDLGPLPTPPPPPAWMRDIFSAEFYTRLIFSCVVDADRLDVAHWPERPPREAPLRCDDLLAAIDDERARRAATLPVGRLVALRERIFGSVIERASLPRGFFSLTAPAGSGKMLAALAFALAHARVQALRRIIVVLPPHACIEQRAAELRRIFGDATVLEHHADIPTRADATGEDDSHLEPFTENWDAPIVLTTAAQWVETLFASSPSRARKLHRVPRSVVIFDDVQALPVHVLPPTFDILRELATNYATSFVFNTSTQLAFRRCAALPDGFLPDEIRPLAPAPAELFRNLRRVRYRFPRDGQKLEWPAVANRLAGAPQTVAIVNLARHASELWQHLARVLPAREAPFYFGASLCPQHRLAVITTMRTHLRDGLPCRAVSTPLLEAGADVDFPEIWRALGPLDSIVQAAGRCNRDGLLPVGHIHLFRPADHGLPPGLYRDAATQGEIVLASFSSEDEAAERLATGSPLFGDYFQSLYGAASDDFARSSATSIQEDRQFLRFREVARKSRLSSEVTLPVVIAADSHGTPWAAPIVDEIHARQPVRGASRLRRDDLRRLQRFMVIVRARTFHLLEARQLVRPLLPDVEIPVLDASCYHPALGLRLEDTVSDDVLP